MRDKTPHLVHLSLKTLLSPDCIWLGTLHITEYASSLLDQCDTKLGTYDGGKESLMSYKC